ncbi:MAG: hypothetical protein QHH06_06405 [Clostridiales bacterium]|jgi:hypothetical protein|nr:cell division protein ZapB [Eubacteriales bacterium]MDH7566096.1 hypothetical protein [Clostridiales bacterium]
MKKFILVMTSILVLTIFAAFNYLVWDRENKIRGIESINGGKSTSIDALGEKIKNLTEENKRLNEKANQLDGENRGLTEKNRQLEAEKQQVEETLDRKNQVIDKLKQHLDPKHFEDIIKKWAEGIDEGQYDIAYDLQEKNPQNPYGSDNLSGFSDKYKGTVKSIKVMSVSYMTEGVPDSRQGDILFKVAMEVHKVDGADNTLFEEGRNDRFFTFSFSKEKNDWLIWSISDTL